MLLLIADILLIAFNGDFLGQALWEGSVTTVGIPIGLGVIISAFVLTGIYTARANSEFDRLNKIWVDTLRSKYYVQLFTHDLFD